MQAVPQLLEYLTDEFPVYRVEPEEDGTIYDVGFNFLHGPATKSYAALEGHGVGKEQWPQDPSRAGYTFLSWYDNPEGTGSPHSMDTPIYKDTELYATWKNDGSGGCWPRPHRGEDTLEYLTVKEAGEKWGVTGRMVTHYCVAGRIKGALKKGNLWLVPADTKKPTDGRYKTTNSTTTP